MEQITINWVDFFKVGFFLLAMYASLRIFLSLLRYSYVGGQKGKKIAEYVKPVLDIFEILSFIILTVLIILISPVAHGLIVFILVLLSYQLLRDYLSGKIILLTRRLKQGHQVIIDQDQGVVQRIGNLGIMLQLNEGRKFINFSKLFSAGYTEIKGKKTGGFHQLILIPESQKDRSKYDHIIHLENKLFNCPYLDWTYKPDIQAFENTPNSYSVRALVKNDLHLKYLIQLINEWNYSCRLED